MTNKIKVFCLIIGLIVCLLIVFTTKAEASQEDTITTKKNDRAVIKQSVLNTGTQWIIKTTYKLLKTN